MNILIFNEANSAKINHSFLMKTIHVDQNIRHIFNVDDQFKIDFYYENEILSKPPKFDKFNKKIGGPQHKFIKAAFLKKIESASTNKTPNFFINKVIEPSSIKTSPYNEIWNARFRYSTNDQRIDVFIEFNVDLKNGDESTTLKNQMKNELNEEVVNGNFSLLINNKYPITGYIL
jgi:hypothetical protein